jgi:hypothetical protein
MSAYTTCVLAVCLAGASPGTQAVKVVTTGIYDPTARLALERAAKAAVDRLERPECQKVLTDFRDASGHTIRETLDGLGETPRQYLARLSFREALDSRCHDSARLAFTYLNQPVVFVCGTRLWQTYRRNPTHVEALVIHEMLHTLGLGENPPTSLQIQAGILKRCW